VFPGRCSASSARRQRQLRYQPQRRHRQRQGAIAAAGVRVRHERGERHAGDVERVPEPDPPQRGGDREVPPASAAAAPARGY
jgi:hypothetical protein